MKSQTLLFSVAIVAALAGGVAHAEGDSEYPRTEDRTSMSRQSLDRHHDRSHDCRQRGAVAGMEKIPNGAQPGHPSHGWQYFSDMRACRAVVINPAGEYFLSRGRGLRQITGPDGWPLPAEPSGS